MLKVKGQTGNETSEEHDGDVKDRQSELQGEIEAHNHVDRVQDDAVSNAHYVYENMDMLPKFEVDGVQQERREEHQQR
jgi:hypothetical protein